jgi:hypothetical protein
MALVKINALSDKLQLKPGGSADCGFDVINATEAPLQIGLDTVGALDKGWLQIEPPVERELPAKGQIKVKVTVKAPAPVKSGESAWSFQLRVFDARHPEQAGLSSAIAVATVVDPAPPTSAGTTTEKKINWPLVIGASAGGVVLIGVMVFVILHFVIPRGVPDLMGKDLNEAKVILDGKGLKANVNYTTSTDAQLSNRVIDQQPHEGETVPDNKTVILTIAQVTPSPPRLPGNPNMAPLNPAVIAIEKDRLAPKPK